jgi:capsular polysaccharide export protein
MLPSWAPLRALFPEAFIVYKAHPDVVSGVRDGGAAPQEADLTARSGDILQWIGWADRVETMTSLAGFEALLRGKAVGVHGAPFYAGWGPDRRSLAHSPPLAPYRS